MMKRIALSAICGFGLLLAGCGSGSDSANGTNKTINPIVSTAPSGNTADATAAGEDQTDCSADENAWTPTVVGEGYEMDCEVQE